MTRPEESPLFVIAVSKSSAAAWLSGRRDDNWLIWNSELQPDVVIVGNLPSIHAYREMFDKVKFWASRGAIGCAFQTCNPIVSTHMLKRGAVKTYTPLTGWGRYYIAHDHFRRWLKMV